MFFGDLSGGTQRIVAGRIMSDESIHKSVISVLGTRPLLKGKGKKISPGVCIPFLRSILGRGGCLLLSLCFLLLPLEPELLPLLLKTPMLRLHIAPHLIILPPRLIPLLRRPPRLVYHCVRPYLLPSHPSILLPLLLFQGCIRCSHLLLRCSQLPLQISEIGSLTHGYAHCWLLLRWRGTSMVRRRASLIADLSS